MKKALVQALKEHRTDFAALFLRSCLHQKQGLVVSKKSLRVLYDENILQSVRYKYCEYIKFSVSFDDNLS